MNTARIKSDVHTKAQEIAKHVAKHGWSSIGADQTEERASISSVIAVAVDKLYERLKKEQP